MSYVIFTETERRIRANNREYNSQFNYAVREKDFFLHEINSCRTLDLKSFEKIMNSCLH